MATAKKKKSRTGLYILIVIACVLLFAAVKVFGPNTGTLRQGEFLYIHTGSNYAKLKTQLQDGGYVSDMSSFNLLAERAQLPAHLHPGKYRIRNGMSNFEIVRLLRSGRQTPVKLVINKLRTKKDFINLLSTNLEADSNALHELFRDEHYLSQFGVDTNTMMCTVIPDTYEFFWNTNADKAYRKIEKNYAHFWDATRKEQAHIHGCTAVQATIIASIVDEETNISEDKPKIASVYINRLQKGMRLQADPTVKFAIGDFSIRRVTGEMLRYNSPYNTYQNDGLPPGPICTPSPGTIDAVLQAPKTSYIYFCATADLSGHSAFASSYDEHEKNATAYRKALNARGIH